MTHSSLPSGSLLGNCHVHLCKQSKQTIITLLICKKHWQSSVIIISASYVKLFVANDLKALYVKGKYLIYLSSKKIAPKWLGVNPE